MTARPLAHKTSASASAAIRLSATSADTPNTRLMRRPYEGSIQPLESLDYAKQRWELELMNLVRQASTMENFEGFVQEEEFKKIADLESKLEPLYEHALQDYVKANPCEAAGNEAYLRNFYSKLAKQKARNELARQLIDAGVEPTW